MSKQKFSIGEPEKQLSDLLLAVREGDDGAFASLVSQYEPLLHASAKRTMAKMSQSGVADEEEMLQEARYALYSAAVTYSFEVREVTFGLYAEICIRNALTSRFLRRSVRRPSPLSLDEMRRTGQFVEPVLGVGDALETLIQNETVDIMYAFIAKVLSPLEWSVFRLHETGMKMEQIAKQLGREKKSVENALARAIKKLRATLTEEQE